MKTKILLLTIAATFFLSCSKDDDGGGEENKTQEELLIEYSPWEFKNVEVFEIIYQGEDNFTNTEAGDIANQYFAETTLEFNADGTGKITVPEGPPDDTFSFNYEVMDSDIYIEGSSFFENYNIEDGVFKFEYNPVIVKEYILDFKGRFEFQ